MNFKEQVISLWQQGYSYSQIAEELDTNKAKVCRIIKPIKEKSETKAGNVSKLYSQQAKVAETATQEILNGISNIISTFRGWDFDLPVSLEQHLDLKAQIEHLFAAISFLHLDETLQDEVRVLRLIHQQLTIDINDMQLEQADFTSSTYHDDFVELLDETVAFKSRNISSFYFLLITSERRMEEYLASF